MTEPALIDRLPEVRGTYTQGARLADFVWFRVGGPADVLFSPADEADLASFLGAAPKDIPTFTVGLGSNLLIRDGGVRGVVIRLPKSFAAIDIEDENRVRAGAAAADAKVAGAARDAGIAGLEFLRGVPGTIGGALRMNAGAYGREVSDILVGARALDREGRSVTLSLEDMGYAYRHASVPEELIFTEALFEGRPDAKADIAARMEEITQKREATQPVKERTGGSTFKNPDPDVSGGRSAWRCVDDVGGRGRVVGDAQVSERHCNFLINRGMATARDLETLGESLREDVRAQLGVTLEWEIKRIGEPARAEEENNGG